ncbi:putative quinol monooxygenase [Qipengyuania qiaonensis]|uniref:Antibiotic biosynthesis monooxygenase n=1 Tax=Qipengyuania qiaonensis TaxID=2867240 RepID=A0ABS7JBD3_9SPHN|nr:antibiotic biosynthesis monooxygenase family protein [Qipengyuania qiaonensis]MBX7482998.1 antibiotic biosynthesis monooxygenase [Qipengyuania qiaonensis]
MSKITFEETIEWFKSTDYAGPIGLTVKFPVPAENADKFRDFLNDYAPYVVKEEGCIEFTWHCDWKDPNAFWLTERWQSAKILLKHLGPDSRPGTPYEGETPLKIMADLGAAPDPAAIYRMGLTD